MKGCNYIKGLIDEADKPELLSFEVNDHISRCGDCESFANDRAQLRRLLASGTRVTAPVNFDAMLSKRLAETRARGGFSWFSPAGYLRLGAATAGLVIMVFAAQQVGLFSDSSRKGSEMQPQVGTTPQNGNGDDRASVAPPEISDLLLRVPPQPQHGPVSAVRAVLAKRNDTAATRAATPAGYATADDGGVVLLRGQNGSMDVSMPTVSVGAQPLLYVSAGQRPARSSVGTSF